MDLVRKNIDVFCTLIVILFAAACIAVLTPGCGSATVVQDYFSAYHVNVESTAKGRVSANSKVVAFYGDAGSEVYITAPVYPDGVRQKIVSRKLDREGVIAWRVELDRDDWLKVHEIPCTEALDELPGLGLCPDEKRLHGDGVILQSVAVRIKR